MQLGVVLVYRIIGFDLLVIIIIMIIIIIILFLERLFWQASSKRFTM